MDLSSFLVNETAKIVDAMRVIDTNAAGAVFLHNDQNQVVASLTDGDIRRHILSSGALDAPVSQIANYQYCYQLNDNFYGSPAPFYKTIPVLNQKRELISVVVNEKRLFPFQRINIPVVIMAGGKGTRLYPYTQVLPKPLIPVGDVTITEHIMNRFKEYACNDFTLIVNHKKEMIKAYFSDTAVDGFVSFVDEDLALGTGGGLALLKNQLLSTFFMTNCDILVDADYSGIYNYHKQQKNIATMVCAAKTVVVPYGTVETDATGLIVSMKEKPEFSFLTNTGFYILEPEFLNEIPQDTFIHITDVLQACIDKKLRVGMYPISETQWSDMGQLEELEKMRTKLGC